MKPSLLLMVALTITTLCTLKGQEVERFPESWTNGTTRSRLEGIYEQRRWAPRRFRATWWSNSEGFSIEGRNQGKRLHFNAKTGSATQTAPPQATPPQREVSPDGKFRFTLRDQNIFVSPTTKKGDERQVTQLENRPRVRIRNLRWSPDSRHISFTEADNREVRLRKMLVPSDPSYPGVREQQFARVGEKITQYRIGIVDVESGTLNWAAIETPEEGFYLGTVEWSGNELLIEWLSRSRDRREFFLASANGKVKRIFSESDPAWVVASQGRNSGLTWIKSGQEFVVISEKDGWRHAYRYSREGKELAKLTPGDYDIIEKASVDEAGGWFYFYASPKNATERYLHRVALNGDGELELITPDDQPGTHAYDFAPNHQWAFHTYSTFDQPPTTELIEVKGHRTVKVLESNERLRSRTEKFVSQPTEFLTLNIDNGIEMDAWMIKPKGFDSSKKYPVFVYVYGEPHAQTVLNEWGAAQSHFLRVIADLGYLVVSIDNRGTPAPKGAAWRRAIFGSLGPLSTEEQAAGLRELGRAHPYVDLSRVGIWGWSGGGSNTLNAMFRKPNDYHLGIAVVPKPQPHLYNAWFQEIFMRTREDNPEGYKNSAPLNFAEGLKGKLLIVTGSGETNTHIQIIEGLVDRLVELGKPFDYMVYPNRNHGLAEGPGTLVHVRMLIARYLLENLPHGSR